MMTNKMDIYSNTKTYQFYLQEVERLYYQHLTCPLLTFSAKNFTKSLLLLITIYSNYVSLFLVKIVAYISYDENDSATEPTRERL